MDLVGRSRWARTLVIAACSLGLAAAWGCSSDEEADPTPLPSDAGAGDPDATNTPDAGPSADAGLVDAASADDAGTADASVDDAHTPNPGYDVFVLAGQSNMVGRGQPFDAALDAPDPHIFQWGRGEGRDGQILPAAARLDHNDTALLDRVGMGLSFAKAYRAAQTTPRPVLLVPTARGGSSFSSQDWNPGDPLYEDTVARTNAALASDAGNRLVAILWHQGENDVGRVDTATYTVLLDRLIDGLRTRIDGAAAVPFVLGQFCPDWQPSPAPTAVLAVIDATPQRRAFTAVAPSTGLVGNLGDLVHFDAPSLRVYGARYAEALVVAQANTPEP